MIIRRKFALKLTSRTWPPALKALPEILAEFPNVVYIVMGATHPNLVREHGEAYRVSLERLAEKNKVSRSVIFYDRFVGCVTFPFRDRAKPVNKASE